MIGTIISIIIAGLLGYYFYRKSASKKDINDLQAEVATKEDVKKVQTELQKTSEKLQTLQSFIDGFAENTPKDEPLRVKIEKADSLYHQKKYKDAYKLYNEINKEALSSGKDKLFALSLIGRGISIGMQGNYQEAIIMLKNAEDYKDFLDNNSKAKLNFNLGYCNQRLKNNDIAIKYYSKSIIIFPDAANAYNNRGNVYTNIGEYKLAFLDYDKAIVLNPEFAAAYSNRGNAYVNIGKHTRAIRDYDKAIELNLEFVEAYNNRGLAYSNQGKHAQAILDYEKAIELDPGFAETYNNQGVVYGKTGNYELAIRDFAKAIKLDTEYAGAYGNLGNAHRLIGDYEKAISDLTKAIELDPKYTGFYFNKALLCEKINKNKEAIKSYKNFLELASDKEKEQITYAKKKIKELQKEIDKSNQQKD